MRDVGIIILCFLLSFSYTIILRICHSLKKPVLNGIGFYIWMALALIVGVLLPGGLLRTVGGFKPAELFRREYLVFLAVCIFTAWFSGYKYGKWKHNIQMIIIFPVFEEILFPGSILPLLLSVRIFTPAIAWIVDGLLFGIMHFQYYGFTKAALRKVIISVFGGFYFSYFAYRTLSIIPSLIGHILFNSSAIFYTRAKAKTEII